MRISKKLNTKTNGFNAENFSEFESAILYILRREYEYDREKDEAWKLFLKYIMDTMFEGYKERSESENSTEATQQKSSARATNATARYTVNMTF